MNGSQCRPDALACLPSMRTTARTGPPCSTVTEEISPVNDSCRQVPSASMSGWSRRRQTSRPSRASTFPSREIESMRVLPCRGSRHCITPVSMTMDFASSMRVSGFAAGDPCAPAVSVRPASRPAPAPMACALHLSEPSGHVASGHDCKGTSSPETVRKANDASFGSLPSGHGTPQVTPGDKAGAPPSSQWSGTAGWSCARAVSARPRITAALARRER